MNKPKKLTAKQKKDRLKEAKARGFVEKAEFTSATGMPNGYVKGSLMVKENYEDEEEFQFNGDVVSTAGWGCIYSAKEDTWGEVTE